MFTKKQEERPKPIKFAHESELPYFTLALATMEWNQTGTWRYLRPCYVERTPSCQASCPTSNNIEKWIKLFEKGETEAAFDAATLENPFPAIMGRVCFHPCMTGCNRNEMGGSVNINMLERELGDAAGKNLPVPKPFFKSTGKEVAVIGSGPAGLSCAYHLKRLGHAVTVFEREDKAGGVLRYGIPSYRLPKDVLDKEIDRLHKMGIRIECKKPVRDASKLQELKQEFDVIFIATGAWRSRPLGIPDEKSAGVMPGLEMLKNLAQGHKVSLGNKVIVVGGGNTAIDSARTARRLGCDVTIVYRRSRAEMPASEEEISAAESEGVKIEFLVAPVRVVVSGKKVTGLECQKMRLGDPDESGRRRPEPIIGSNTVFQTDSVLTAVGEEIDPSLIPSALHIEKGSLVAHPGGRTEWSHIFAGGDLIDAPRTVVDALSSGKKSAVAIDCYLRKENFDTVFDKIKISGTEYVLMSKYIELRLSGDTQAKTTEKVEVQNLNEVVKFDDLNSAYFKKSAPVSTPALQPSERLEPNPFVEVHFPCSPDDRAKELSRCFHCGRCTECDNCYIYCPDVAIAKKQGGFSIDLFFCKGCGVCNQECPRAAMKMDEEPMEL